jgi:hypothetical protein
MMKTTIGDYDAATKTVPVTFEEGDVTHERSVNACHDEAGSYDATATAARVADVARGVAVKIGLGVITNKPAEPEAAPAAEAEPAPAA